MIIEIKDLLVKIDNLKIEKFRLDKDSRIFLKRLLFDEVFLNNVIERVGGNDVFFKLLENIYEDFVSIKNNFDNIKKASDNSNCDEFINVIDKYIFKDTEEIERDKEIILDEFVNNEIKIEKDKVGEDLLKKEESNRINEILNKLNNN